MASRTIKNAMIESIHRQQPQLSRVVVRRRFVNRADQSTTILAPVEDQCRWLHTIGFAEMDCYFKIYELAVFEGQKPM